jgi:hypothetical protein
MLASLLFPYDEDSRGLIDQWLLELTNEGCIIRYQIANDSYVKICKWQSHQKIDRPSKSKIPDPREDSRDFDEPSRDTHEPSLGDQGSRIKEGIKDLLPEP